MTGDNKFLMTEQSSKSKEASLVSESLAALLRGAFRDALALFNLGTYRVPAHSLHRQARSGLPFILSAFSFVCLPSAASPTHSRHGLDSPGS